MALVMDPVDQALLKAVLGHSPRLRTLVSTVANGQWRTVDAERGADYEVPAGHVLVVLLARLAVSGNADGGTLLIGTTQKQSPVSWVQTAAGNTDVPMLFPIGAGNRVAASFAPVGTGSCRVMLLYGLEVPAEALTL